MFYPGRALFDTPISLLSLAFLSGVVNILGAWSLLAAMKTGGQISVVVPCTALYPILVVIAAPLLFDEALQNLQLLGVVCALAATAFLAME